MSALDNAPEHIPYTITGVRESQTFGPSNQLEDVLEVTFSGPNGGSYTVKLPLEQATPAAIDVAIEERLDQIQGIHALGPEPHPENAA